jgi:hypothetical protein
MRRSPRDVSTTNIGFWRHPDIKLYRFAGIGLLTLPIIVILFFIYLFWVFGALLTLPSTLSDYAAIYFMVYVVVVPVNILVPWTRRGTLYVLGLFFNIGSCLVMTWLWFNVFFKRYNCYDETLPLSCRDNQLFELILLFIVSLVCVLQFIILLMYCIILRGVSHIRSVVVTS